MNWDKNYRPLKSGEIIEANDEVDACNDGWRDKPMWKKVNEKSIGQPAPDYNLPSHRVYRRKIEQ
jgi:hypothetical protein